MALTDNLVSYWKCDEASGNLTDAHGSNTGTAVNTPGAGTGKISGARTFVNASAQYFTIADGAGVSTGDIDFTWQAWVNLTNKTTYRMIVGKWVTPNYEYILFYDQANDRFSWQVSANGTAGVAVLANNLGSPSTGTWYHVIGWHDSVNNEIGIAVNAGTANTTSHTTGVRDGTAALRIGNYEDGTGLSMNGSLDEIGFWKRVLTSGERTQLYNSGSGLAYPFSQTVSPGLLDTVTTIYPPTITPGPVTLSPSLLTNTQTFYGETLAPGSVTVAPGLLTNSQSFYAPIIGDIPPSHTVRNHGRLTLLGRFGFRL